MASPAPGIPPARERILNASYELFSRLGIRAVGVDEVISRAGIAKATLYRHFPTKDSLVLAFLDERERRWTLGFVEAEARRRGSTPQEQLLAIFDVFDEWFREPDFDACVFTSALLEMGPKHPVGQASMAHLAAMRQVVATLAEAANLRDPHAFARSWHILMKGSIMLAVEGDVEAAHLAQAMGRQLVTAHQQPKRRGRARPLAGAKVLPGTKANLPAAGIGAEVASGSLGTRPS